MKDIPYKRGTLLIPTGTSFAPDKKHLHVVCTDTCVKGLILIVPLCTWTNRLCDSTCILEAYEHPFLKHKTYVMYRSASLRNQKNLAIAVKNGQLHVKEDLNAQSFLKVYRGICKSDRTLDEIKTYMGC